MPEPPWQSPLNLSPLFIQSLDFIFYFLYLSINIYFIQTFQTIVEEICGENASNNTQNMAIKKPIKLLKKVLDYDSKEKLSVQLCGLLRSVVQCLKGGQSLQYTSLLLINKIIDTLIIYDVSRFPIELNETQVFVRTKERDANKKHKSSESASQKKSHQIITQMPSIMSADNNQKQIITSLKTTTMNSSFKENQMSNNGSHSVQQRFKRKATDKSRITRKTISNWLRGKPFSSGHTASVKKDSSGTNISGGAGGGQRTLGIKLSGNTDGAGKQQIVGETTSLINTNLLSILVSEGIDLILNVLNNAITLHKRVTGSKQCCTPSHR